MPRTTGNFAAIFEDVYARWRSHRAAQRTRRAIADLPTHIRKDIGWPDPVPAPRGRRRGSLWSL